MEKCDTIVEHSETTLEQRDTRMEHCGTSVEHRDTTVEHCDNKVKHCDITVELVTLQLCSVTTKGSLLLPHWSLLHHSGAN